MLDAGDGDSGLLSTNDLVGRVTPFDLVVLSACSTGDGVLIVGQALYGLVSSLLDGGARLVVATRCPVEDAAMATFIGDFYDRLSQVPDVSAALAAARRAARARGDSPAIWAGVEAYGDPTTTVRLAMPTPSWWSRLKAFLTPG